MTILETALICSLVVLAAAPVMPRVASGLAAAFEGAASRAATPPPCVSDPHWSDPGHHAAIGC